MKPSDPLLITPQQVKRFLRGMGFTTLLEAREEVTCPTQAEADADAWDAWERKGLRRSDLVSRDAQALAESIAAYEAGSVILTALQVRTWREAMGLSQPEAAEYLGVSRSTWSRWEQLGITDHYAGTAAYALAASVTSKDPVLVAERDQEIHKVLDLEKALGRVTKSPIQEAIAVSTWGGQGEYARLGMGSFGLYLLLRDAWETATCAACSTKNPARARFCSSCGAALAPAVGVTKPQA